MAAVVSFHRLAAKEYREARSWYAERNRKTALRFVEAMDRALTQIADAPTAWPLYDDRHRWVKLKKFPYLLFFRLKDAEHIAVVSVAHASRRPGYWRRRK